MNNYKEKIKKLLALSESPVQAEAEAALLKARELMAKYKIEQSELESCSNMELTIKYIEEIYYSRRKDFWLHEVCLLVGENFPVVITVSHRCGKQSRTPVVLGYSDDVEIAVQIIKYIYDSVYSWSKAYSKKNQIKSKTIQSEIRNGFGLGFCRGWEKALREQKKQNPEWGLMLVKPDVSSIANIKGNYNPKVFEVCAKLNIYAYEQGEQAGISYGSKRRIE